jgi:uncharacterized protein YndB with AHSA1/START domain
MSIKQTVLTKDAANKKITVVREFDAPIDQVWEAWTVAELLDQWWAPRPWKAVTVSMDFRDGGSWLYYMQGPEGEKHYCRADYSHIVPGISYQVQDAFTDENGVPNGGAPSMHWHNVFSASGDGTKVTVEITFEKAEDLETIIQMGFQEGFTAANGNLDELLASRQ